MKKLTYLFSALFVLSTINLAKAAPADYVNSLQNNLRKMYEQITQTDPANVNREDLIDAANNYKIELIKALQADYDEAKANYDDFVKGETDLYNDVIRTHKDAEAATAYYNANPKAKLVGYGVANANDALKVADKRFENFLEIKVSMHNNLLALEKMLATALKIDVSNA